MKRVVHLVAILAGLVFSAAMFLPVSPAYRWTFGSFPGRVLAQVGVELACPAGSVPAIFAGSVTRNPTNEAIRYNFCVTQSNGHLFYQGDGGGAPSGPANSVQFNNGGAFGGTSSFTYDGAQSVSIGNGALGVLTISSSAAPASAGALRLPIAGGVAKNAVAWRNQSNSGDLSLVPNASNQLTFAGTGVCMADGTNCPTGAVTKVDLTAQSADIAATTILTPSADGFYRASAYLVLTRAATTSASLPNLAILFRDADSNTNETVPLVAPASGDNLLGSIGPAPTPAAGQGQFVFGFYAKAGNAIQYRTAGYASSGATSMQYAVHLRLEGPF